MRRCAPGHRVRRTPQPASGSKWCDLARGASCGGDAGSPDAPRTACAARARFASRRLNGRPDAVRACARSRGRRACGLGRSGACSCRALRRLNAAAGCECARHRLHCGAGGAAARAPCSWRFWASLGAPAVRAVAAPARCGTPAQRLHAQRSRQGTPNATSAGTLRSCAICLLRVLGLRVGEPLPGHIRCALRRARQGSGQPAQLPRALARLAAAAAVLCRTRIGRCSCVTAAAAVAAGCAAGGRGWRR